jgi:hypothetical protein
MSFRTKILLPAGLLVCVGGGTLAGVQHERIAFVAKCWGNANPVAQCNCTFDALPELPNNYRDHAVSWAHDSGMTHAGRHLYLVWKEAVRIGGEKVAQTADLGDGKTAIGSGLGWVARVIGLEALKEVAPGLEPTAAAIAVALPLVDNAVEELAAAQRVYDRHCGTGSTLIVRLSDASRGVKRLAQALPGQSMDAATRAGAAAAEAARSATGRLWRWVKSWF